MEPASTGREADGREADGREALDIVPVSDDGVPAINDLTDAVNDLKPITASTGPLQTEGLRVERFGRAGPDGVGRYWQWRWWEVSPDGKKERKGRYGGIVNTEAAEYWRYRSTPPSNPE